MLLIYVFFNADGPMIIPQDCIGTTLFGRGIVVDDKGLPVESAQIRVSSWGYGSEELSDSESVQTDVTGSFILPGIFTFACNIIEIEVTADHFLPWKQQFTPPTDEYDWPDELPSQLHITLQRAPS